MRAVFPRARSWVFALPVLVALAACDRTPTEPFPDPFAAAKGGHPPAKPVVSKIAFGSDHQGFTGIYVVDPDGQNLALVTMPPVNRSDMEPSLSPGAAKVVFTRANSSAETSELYIATVNNGQTQQLTNFGVLTGSPALSPDGKKVAFVSDKVHPGAAAQVNVYVMNLDGSGLELVDSTMRGSRPAWSADGSKLYYTTGLFLSGVHNYAIMIKELATGITTPKWWSPYSMVSNPVIDHVTGRVMFEQHPLDQMNPVLFLAPDSGVGQVLPVGDARVGGFNKDGSRFVFAPIFPSPVALRVIDMTSVGQGTLVVTDLPTPALWAQAPTWSR